MIDFRVGPNELGSLADHIAVPVVYWMPPRFVVSAWLEHAPFAYWLMQAASPRRLVELGTHNGYSFFVFAEAAKRLQLDTELFALDSWVGDDQAGFYGDDVYDGVAAVVGEDYPTARLVRGNFIDSVDRFEDGSIDVLHVDGRHGYDDVAEDFELYRPKLSNKGIVLFHDTFEFQPGFGVHQFWNEMSHARPSFNFEHGHGLGVLAWGSEVPRPVVDFIDRAHREPELVREWFASLGAEVSRQFVLEVDHSSLIHSLRLEKIALLAEVEEREHSSQTLTKSVESLRDEVARSHEEISRIQGTLSWKVTKPLRGLRRAVTSR